MQNPCRPFFLVLTLCALLSSSLAEGTKTWEQSKFEDLTKGTATGVAIRSNGGLELAPAFKPLYATPSTYIWAIAADDAGNVFAAAGSPTRVYRVTPDGKATVIFEPQELQVQALVVAPGGAIYAATSPDGKVYRIEHTGADQPATKAVKASDAAADASKPALDPAWNSSVYFSPGTKYIWALALDKAANLYVATGDHGEIYKVTPKGEHSLFFKSDETHIRTLAFEPQGNLIAGTDGSGLVYRITPAGEGFVLYSAPKKEITALALDSAGNIYAAGVGEKKTSGLPVGVPTPIISIPSSAPAVGGAPSMGVTVTPAVGAISMTGFPFPGGGATGGSDIYRISPDGSPLRIWTSHDDIVYALAFDAQGVLLAGTGNRGHIFSVAGADDFSDLLKAPASQITALAKAPGGGVYAASSNLGKLFVLGPGPEKEGTYESDVFDARNFSRWGRVEFRGSGSVDLLVRSGNVDNPDRNWSPWKPVELGRDTRMEVPAARYAQWKAVLHAGGAGPSVDSVTLNYLPKNIAPEIDEVTVQVGTRYQPPAKSTSTSGTDSSSTIPHYESPPSSTHDRDAIGVKWSAHDDNDDQLVYSLYYKGDGQSRWLLLKDSITDKVYSFDASLLPDGGYVVKLLASDAPSHSPSDALTTEKTSRRFEVDTTPPRIENLSATVEGGQMHIRCRAVDGFSIIKRAEYSIDAADWQYVEPVGQLADAKTEDYDFRAPIENGKNSGSEHVVVVRAYDRYDNLGAAKIVVTGKPTP